MISTHISGLSLVKDLNIAVEVKYVTVLIMTLLSVLLLLFMMSVAWPFYITYGLYIFLGEISYITRHSCRILQLGINHGQHSYMEKLKFRCWER